MVKMNINDFCLDILENRQAFQDAYKNLCFENWEEVADEDDLLEEEEPEYAGTLSAEVLYKILKKSRFNYKMRRMLVPLMEYIDGDSLNDVNFRMITSLPSRQLRESVRESLAHMDLSFYQNQMLNQNPPWPFESCFTLIENICKYDCFKTEDMRKTLSDNPSILQISSYMLDFLDECERKYGASGKLKEARTWIQENSKSADLKSNQIRVQWEEEEKEEIALFQDMIRRIVEGEDVPEEEVAIRTAELYMRNVPVEAEWLEKLTGVEDPAFRNNDFWESIVDAVSVDSLNDTTMQFLYDNHFATDSMSLKDLPDTWLRKYAAVDEDTLCNLADKSMQKPDEDFMQFIREYALHSPFLFQYLLDETEIPERLKKLLFLGLSSENTEVRKIAETEYELVRIRFTRDTDALRNVYTEHAGDSRWLMSLAENPNTPEDVLKQLIEITEVEDSHKIRKAGKETLDFVESCSPKMRK